MKKEKLDPCPIDTAVAGINLANLANNYEHVFTTTEAEDFCDRLVLEDRIIFQDRKRIWFARSNCIIQNNQNSYIHNSLAVVDKQKNNWYEEIGVPGQAPGQMFVALLFSDMFRWYGMRSIPCHTLQTGQSKESKQPHAGSLARHSCGHIPVIVLR